MDNQFDKGLGEHLLRFNKKQKFLFFDTETCNLNLASLKNVPWEYAWILATQKDELEKKEYLVQWDEIPISPDAAAMTGFYSKQHRIPTHGKTPEFVLADFERLLYDESVIPVAHNGLGFDIYMHRIHRLRCGLKADFSYLERMYDTNVLGKAQKLGITPPVESNRLAWQFRLLDHRRKGIKTSLGVLCAEAGIPYVKEEAHAALYDVERLKDLFFKQIFSIEI